MHFFTPPTTITLLILGVIVSVVLLKGRATTLEVPISGATAISSSSWDLELNSVDTDFDKDSADEITLMYKIGKGCQYEVFMLKEDCSTSITDNVVTFTSSTSDIEGDTSNSNLQVSVDIEMSSIAASNIWVNGTDSTAKVVKLCAKAQLVSGVRGGVVKKLEHVIEVELDFDFENNFQTIQNAIQIASGDL